jgi:hypothetical protein
MTTSTTMPGSNAARTGSPVAESSFTKPDVSDIQFRRRSVELRAVLLSCVSNADMAAITDQLVVRAREGQMAAIKLLFHYTLRSQPITAALATLPAPTSRPVPAGERLSAKDLAEALHLLESGLGAFDKAHSPHRVGGSASAPPRPVNGQHADPRRTATGAEADGAGGQTTGSGGTARPAATPRIG